MNKIIVYDFDKTLTEKDTLLGFFLFNEKRNFFLLIKCLLYFNFMMMSKLKIISNDRLKSLGITIFLKNLAKEKLEYKFLNYKDAIKYNWLFEKTDFTINDTYIVSASFQEYLKPIFPKNVKVLASSIAYNDDKISGLQFNCYGKNKVTILQNMNINEIDIFYTDSISDLPLVKISKKIILIKNNTEYECSDIEDFIKKAKQ